MVSVDDVSARPAVALSDGETLSLGEHIVQWIDTTADGLLLPRASYRSAG
jgi:hypothetical protein